MSLYHGRRALDRNRVRNSDLSEAVTGTTTAGEITTTINSGTTTTYSSGTTETTSTLNIGGELNADGEVFVGDPTTTTTYSSGTTETTSTLNVDGELNADGEVFVGGGTKLGIGSDAPAGTIISAVSIKQTLDI